MEDDNGGLQLLGIGASTDLCAPLKSMGEIAEADCSAVLPGKGREWIDSVEKLGCKQLKWPCPLESDDIEDNSDEVDHAAQEAECTALKLYLEAPDYCEIKWEKHEPTFVKTNVENKCKMEEPCSAAIGKIPSIFLLTLIFSVFFKK